MTLCKSKKNLAVYIMGCDQEFECATCVLSH